VARAGLESLAEKAQGGPQRVIAVWGEKRAGLRESAGRGQVQGPRSKVQSPKSKVQGWASGKRGRSRGQGERSEGQRSELRCGRVVVDKRSAISRSVAPPGNSRGVFMRRVLQSRAWIHSPLGESVLLQPLRCYLPCGRAGQTARDLSHQERASRPPAVRIGCMSDKPK
jgi:hypothetical protein